MDIKALLFAKTTLAGGWLAAMLIAEQLFPAAIPSDPDPGEPAGKHYRLGRNLSLWIINLILSPLIIVPLTAWTAGHALQWRAALAPWWQGGGGLILDLLILDLFIYGWHRANHRISFLWRFHQVHHRDRFLDATSSLRFHFGEVILSALVRGGFILGLGIPLSSVGVFEVLLLMAAAFHHSNIRLPPTLEKCLAKLIVTPSIHWVHHHRRRQDTDSNYATIISWWDVIFASRSEMKRTMTMPIGVEGEPELRLTELLILPVQNKKSRLK